MHLTDFQLRGWWASQSREEEHGSFKESWSTNWELKGGGVCWWPDNFVLVSPFAPLEFLLHRRLDKSSAAAERWDPASPTGGCVQKKTMNWKIKEFTVKAKSMRRELALLVKNGAVRSGGLPRASAFHLLSHPTIHPPTLRPCRLCTPPYSEANAAGYRSDRPRLKPPRSAPLGAAEEPHRHISMKSPTTFILPLVNADSQRTRMTLRVSQLVTSGHGGRRWLQTHLNSSFTTFRSTLALPGE